MARCDSMAASRKMTPWGRRQRTDTTNGTGSRSLWHRPAMSVMVGPLWCRGGSWQPSGQIADQPPPVGRVLNKLLSDVQAQDLEQLYDGAGA